MVKTKQATLWRKNPAASCQLFKPPNVLERTFDVNIWATRMNWTWYSYCVSKILTVFISLRLESWTRWTQAQMAPNKNSRRYMNETQSSLKHAASCVQESQFTKRRTGFGILKDLTLWHVRREANTILRINYYRLNRTTPLLNIWGQIWIYPDLWTDLSRLYQRISKLPKLNLKAPHSFSLKL